MRIVLCILVALAACVSSLQAQIQVNLTLKRHFYVAYEPIVATVSVTNLAGRDIPLADENGHQWFGFTVLRQDGMPLPPLNPNYQLTPLTIPAGGTVKRNINLNTLYPVHDYGPYKVRAVIYFGAVDKFYQSNALNFEISEGKTVWQQIVCVPEGQPDAGANRRITLMKFRQTENNELYVRVQDTDTALVYCTTALGRLLDNNEPEIQLDALNRVHVLQIVAAKTYRQSVISPTGEISDRQTYLSTTTPPFLSRDSTGMVLVKNGSVYDPNSPLGGMGSANQKGPPKISDHPVELPSD